MNSVFVLILVPSLVYLYSLLERNGIRFTILQRMGMGFSLVTIAYGISGVMQIFVIKSFQPGVNTEIIGGVEVCTDPKTCISSWWLVIQWFLLSLGESFIRYIESNNSPEGLKLTYMNVGPLMKSQSLAIWLMMNGLGSLFTLLISKGTENFIPFNEFKTERALRNPDHGISLPLKFLFFFSICLLGNIWFVLWAKYVFKYRDESCSMTKIKKNGSFEESSTDLIELNDIPENEQK